MKKVVKYNFISVLQKIAIVDKLAASLFFIILAIMAFFFLRKGEYVYLTLLITQDESLTYQIWGKPPPWFIENLKPGIKIKDIFGREEIQVIDMYQYDTNNSNRTQDTYVILKINSVFNKRNGQYSYKGVPLVLGSYQKFLIQNFQLKGLIRALSKTYSLPEKKKFVVKGFLDPKNNDFPGLASNYDNTIYFFNTLKTDGIPKTISSAIVNGMKIIDTHDKPIVTIKSVSKTPAYYIIPANGQLSYDPAPDREKVELELEIEADIINGKPFFKGDSPLNINQLLQLSFSSINLSFTISAIEPSESNEK